MSSPVQLNSNMQMFIHRAKSYGNFFKNLLLRSVSVGFYEINYAKRIFSSNPNVRCLKNLFSKNTGIEFQKLFNPDLRSLTDLAIGPSVRKAAAMPKSLNPSIVLTKGILPIEGLRDAIPQQ